MKELREAVEQARAGKRRGRFTKELKGQLQRAMKKLHSSGVTHGAIATTLGVSTQTVQRYLKRDEVVVRPVRVTALSEPRVLRTPDGYEASGLDVDEMARLIRALR
ncbi:MAG: helix-turn-helix domain-containing protein [Myxococcota bacterium]